MELRSRFVRSLTFDTTAAPLSWHMYGLMPKVLDRWHSEGLPSSVDETQITRHFGFDGYGWLREMIAHDGEAHSICLSFPVEFDPPFQAKVIEDTPRHTVQTDSLGRVTRVMKGVSTLPRVITYSFKEPSDWPNLKQRLQFSKKRFRSDWLRQFEEMRSHELPVVVHLQGFFGFPREIMGEVTMARTYYQKPDLMHQILESYLNLIIEVAEHILSSAEIDVVSFAEDMAYRHGPMISPRLFREFILPYYREVVDTFHGRGTRIFAVDTDGNLDLLIPLLMEAGINLVGPLEVQAGNDLVELRNRFGKKMAFFGGLDKLALTRGRDAVDAELDPKMPAMLRTSGYAVGLDHRVVPQTPLDTFDYYACRVKDLMHGSNT